jgi:arsenite-transporting ATPase
MLRRLYMSLSEMDISAKRVLMFGGKGGVGKTTCSATAAVHYASLGRRTLIITSDMTPSLSDIFEMKVGPEEKPVRGVDNLYALEIGPDEVIRRWKGEFGPEIYKAASVLVDMEYDEIVDYVAMAPGIQEEFMLYYILEKIKDGSYDLIVWDTAPAGDTLRLLQLPRKFIQHLRIAPKVYLQIRDTLKLQKTPFLDLIESWKELAQEVTEFLRDQRNTEFILVTIPEGLGVYQARRLIDQFDTFGLDARYLLVNNVIVDPQSDFTRRRRSMQDKYLDMLQEEYGHGMKIIQLPLLPDEVKGVESLRKMEEVLFAE